MGPVMSHDRLLEICIDPDDPRNERLLSEVQGNILKGHGRQHSLHFHLRFTSDASEVRSWLRQFADDYVTSARQQHQDAQAYRQGIASDRMFVNLMFSASGYRALGVEEGSIPGDPRFRLGMGHDDVRAWLHDPPGEEWEQPYQGRIDALVIVANASDPTREAGPAQLLSEIKGGMESIGSIVAEEHGQVLRREVEGKSRSYEHFGFLDGLSQPLFLKSESCTGNTDSPLHGWDPRAHLGLVLVEDPGGQEPESFGSYFVYRKLSQNVERFNRLIGDLVEQTGIEEDFARAQVVGRFEDGQPLIDSRGTEEGYANGEARLNAFDYSHDRDGRVCPFHAHIRKVNPRGEKQYQGLPPFSKFIARHGLLLHFFPKLSRHLEDGRRSERARRIARRGVPYGPPGPVAEEERGLLFLCAQADIGEQFEFIQNIWANKNTFPRDGAGQDAVIGQAPQQVGPRGQQWLVAKRGRKTETFDFRACVRLRGGEYFFAPSLSFLRNL